MTDDPKVEWTTGRSELEPPVTLVRLEGEGGWVDLTAVAIEDRFAIVDGLLYPDAPVVREIDFVLSAGDNAGSWAVDEPWHDVDQVRVLGTFLRKWAAGDISSPITGIPPLLDPDFELWAAEALDDESLVLEVRLRFWLNRMDDAQVHSGVPGAARFTVSRARIGEQAEVFTKALRELESMPPAPVGPGGP